MTTTLKPRAYWIPAVLIFIPILFWMMVENANSSGAVKFDYTSYFLLISALCIGIVVYTLFFDYQEYSFDSQNLNIKNLITKKQTSIPLKSITNLKLHEKSMRNGHYHNIIVETKNGEYTLKGVYINEMIQFFYELEKAVKQ
ncbi:MAG: hypothetical protein MUC49_04855 [Raineya sp.]|jgi:hypothetical protein|nr:hypothetical protein [Raineya sp.]